MSSIYSAIYHALCESHKPLITQYGPKSGLHNHHIIPKHMGGKDEQENYTYLNPTEHSFAHYLLWLIHHNPNDLRSMHMLGVKLTPEQRKITGIFCRDNRIGIFDPVYKENRKEWSMLGYLQQKTAYELNGDTNNFYWWSTPEGRKKRSSLGGKAGAAVQMEKQIGFFDPIERRKWSSLGGKAHLGKKEMYRPGDNTFKRVKQEDIQRYLELGFIFGRPGRGVTDGTNTFISVRTAAEHHNMTKGQIEQRCKSNRCPDWSFIYDI